MRLFLSETYIYSQQTCRGFSDRGSDVQGDVLITGFIKSCKCNFAEEKLLCSMELQKHRLKSTHQPRQVILHYILTAYLSYAAHQRMRKLQVTFHYYK